MKDLGQSFPKSERKLEAMKSRLIVCREFLLQNLPLFNRHIEGGFFDSAQNLGESIVNTCVEARKLSQDIRQMQLDLEKVQEMQAELTLSAGLSPKRLNGNPARAFTARAGAVSGGGK